MQSLPWLIPIAPLVAAVLCGLLSLGGRGRHHAHWVAWTGLFIAAVCSIVVLSTTPGGATSQLIEGYSWLNIGAIQVPIALRIDSISAVQICVVTCISFLVAVYSKGYMHDDPGYARFFAVFSGFVFAMSMLVLSSNLLLLYAFWEGVGLCSYLLIGFWFHKPSAAAAATKAFLVNRVADCGFLIGILCLWFGVGLSGVPVDSLWGRLNFDTIFEAVPVLATQYPSLLVFIGFMLLMGAVGKSAQFPLHVWLPDAMEGPTPVSALIHAATMVTAGVFLMARMSPLLISTPEVLLWAGWLGAITALLAALIALFQDDLKRVLAYSTVSQLGYMFVAIGTGVVGETPNSSMMVLAVTYAMFHLMTHAFFKALLFLSAGNVMHAMGDVIDMREFGGLRKIMPITNILFLIGAAALAGVPPLAGFWSKDGILGLAAANMQHPQYGMSLTCWLAIGLITALLTSVYTFRAYFRTFLGYTKVPAAAGDHAHEAAPVMLAPMALLAVGSVLAGLAVGPTEKLGHFLGEISYLPEVMHVEHESKVLMLISAVIAVGGIGLAWITTRPGFSAEKFGGVGTGLANLGANRFYLDEIFSILFVAPVQLLGKMVAGWDVWGFDGIWNFVSDFPASMGRSFRQLQNGVTSKYALGFALGVLVLIMLVALRGGA